MANSSDGFREIVPGLQVISMRDLMKMYADPPLDTPSRTMTRRGAMQWAIQFALEQPGSVGLILGATQVSLVGLFRGRDGLRHCLDDRQITPSRIRWAAVELGNGSQIRGLCLTSPSDVNRLDGLNINYVVTERADVHPRVWERLQTRIRPLPGAENCIITIVDDEADE